MQQTSAVVIVVDVGPVVVSVVDKLTTLRADERMALFLNELHYDNNGADIDEFVEVAGPAGMDVGGYRVLFYNGRGGVVYGELALSGVLPDQAGGFGALSFPATLQNGQDGLALVSPDDRVLQFLSYEGSFVASSGAAAGVQSFDIGVSETSATPAGSSLQLTRSSSSGPSELSWTAGAASPGLLNVDQSIAVPSQQPPSPPPVTTSHPPPSPHSSFTTDCPSRQSVRASLLGHTVLPYTASSTDVWDALKDLDADPADPAKVTCFYSRLSVNAAQEYNSGRGWTREHLWPQSLGNFDAHANQAPATDLFALRPAKQRCNSMRNNFKYGEVAAAPDDE
eukprot:CAMPEP_0119341266 /NCGR_PEP_ID=MMETSP1333-20130426/101984_1 /TAXON_ID=418940 /ORGANISM="Scyphosphaera apsteinii, Strain RCC1455" /LENGTH=337 /DNA_ID=CAMNT_0007353189 /DNA_START=71 /DNA_END=1082 /DNA_ORIENTATION=+